MAHLFACLAGAFGVATLATLATMGACSPVQRNYGLGVGGGGFGGGFEGGAGGGDTGGGAGGSCPVGTTGCPCAAMNTCALTADTCINGACVQGCCAGYTEMGGQCVFGGGPADPGFMSATTWTAVNGATIDPTGAGVDLGQAVFGSTCTPVSGVSQTYPSPQASCAQPMMLNFHAQTNCVGSSCSAITPAFLALGVNGAWNDVFLDKASGFATYGVCLGGAALGGMADLFLGVGRAPAPCTGTTIDVDQVTVSVVDTSKCLLPGTIPNGNFESGAQSWTLLPNAGTAEIEAGAGDGASMAGHLASTQFCEDPTIAGIMSIPTAAMVPNPAIRVWSKGSTGALGQVVIGTGDYQSVTQIPGTGAITVQDVCIPRWAQGTSHAFGLNLGATVTSAGMVCGNPNVRDFLFDDLAFVTDLACDAAANLFDAGFERVSLANKAAPFWNLGQYTDQPGATVVLKEDAANAHSGNVYALLTSTHGCTNVTISGGVTVPITTPTAGPALKFWYRTSAMVNSSVVVSMAAMTAPPTITVSASWKQVTVCLDPRLATRPDTLTFLLNGGGLAACATYPAESLSLDDVSLVTDSTCPGM